jgi:hypothetical protein
VLDQILTPVIRETLGQSTTQPEARIDLPQEQCAPIATEVATRKIRHYFART